MNIAFIRRIKSRFCPHKEIKTSEIFFLWSDSHFMATACINQWIIVIFNNNIMNKFWFKFFWAVESNCSSDCMYVCSEFLSDSHFIVTACINQWIIVIYNNNIMNKFRFKFFWAASSFNNDKKNIGWISDQHPVNWFHWILTLFWSQICFYNPWVNQFWAFSEANGWGQIPWKRNIPCSTFLVIHSCL